MTFADDLRFLRRTIELADEAVANGNHPFGSLLVDASGEIIGCLLYTSDAADE